MQQPLGLQALKWLSQLEQRLKANGSETVDPSKKAAAQVIGWCIEQQLLPAHSKTLPKVRLDIALLEQIATAQRQLGHACFRDNPQQMVRLEAAKHSQQELKSAGLKPRQQRVLLRLPSPTPLAGIDAHCIDSDWQQLPLQTFDALLVVENLDCFYQLEQFSIKLPYRQPLVIYRGDRLYSQGCKALKTAWLSQRKPAIYFGDFDGKGVSIALNEGYQAMLLPALAELQQQASAAMLPDEQLKFLPAIEQHPASTAFQPYQQLLCQPLKGLRQQQMQGIALEPIPLHSNPWISKCT